mmetsp:Transcript_79915/g.159564  ORF Transcript_79915/g.159564 Transcript_79915/m.159564 type:complete len:370 (-) Transcript_79915:565-1674(-)
MAAHKWKMPHGGTLRTGEKILHGGQLNWIGAASLELGERLSPGYLGPGGSSRSKMGNRQLASARAFAQALNAKSLGALLIERAAFRLELRLCESNVDLSTVTPSESAFMATHRWVISSLPANVVACTVEVARAFRDSVAAYEPVIGSPLPDARVLLSGIGATVETRADVACLLNVLLGLPFTATCYVFSESKGCAVLAWRAFSPRPELKLGDAQDVDDLLARATLQEQTSTNFCFWCRATTLSADLKPCAGCKRVRYCGETCQLADWKAYHKAECKKIGSVKKGQGSEAAALEARKVFKNVSRHDKVLEQEMRATYQIPVDKGDTNSVWCGDEMRLTLTGLRVCSGGGEIFEATKGFPTGWMLYCRELM